MSILANVLHGAPLLASTPAPDHPYWYHPAGTLGGTQAGFPVSPETAMKLGAVNACVGLLADMVGMLPLLVYRREGEDGKVRATTLPAYDRLHRRPNVAHTAKEWRTMGQADLLLRGNFYNLIADDGQLVRLHPDRVRVTAMPGNRRGYLYRPPGAGVAVPYTQEEIFHVMGLSLDGLVGCSVIEYAAESISASHAQEGSSARFWRQGAEGHLAFIAPQALSDTSRKNNEEALRSRMSGWANAHQVLLLEGGIKPERISVSAKDAQHIESRQFSVSDIARFFRVPPHMIGDVTGSTSWGTGIEQQTIGFVNFTLMPWLVNFEQAAERDLLPEGGEYFAEFLVDALMRGDAVSRAQSYQIATGGRAWMSPNDVRRRENMNPEDGLDEVERGVQGITTTGTQMPKPAARRMAPPPDDEEDDAAAALPRPRVHAIALANATRLVRREIKAIREHEPKLRHNAGAWRMWCADFYSRHVDVLVESLCLDTAAARRYGAAHCDDLLTRGLAALDAWDHEAPAALVALALGTAVAAPSATAAPSPPPVHVTFERRIVPASSLPPNGRLKG